MHVAFCIIIINKLDGCGKIKYSITFNIIFYNVEPVWTTILLSRNRYPVGSNITIPCAVTGHPPPRVTWYRNGEELYQSEKHKLEGMNFLIPGSFYLRLFVAVSGENYTLTITSAEMQDAGTYKCEAKNNYLQSEAEIAIDIEGMGLL